jgi:sec-independent protein translocase protein TatC
MSKNEDVEDEGMTFWEHLEELRSRLVKMILSALLGSAGAWLIRERLLLWLVIPFRDAWKQLKLSTEPQLNFPDPAGLFIAYLKISIIGGVILSLPLIFYQLWAFVAPGLYAREKRYAIPFMLASTGLFVGGAYFGMTFVFPVAFHYLLSFAGPIEGFQVNPVIMVDAYISFITRMLVAFGVAAELPVVIFFLSVAGLVNYKQLIGFFRYFIVLAFLVAAVITPPDLLSQFMLAVPLCFLYALSIVIAYFFGKKPEAETP